MNNKPIYLDYNATTPLDPHVLDEMLPYFKDEFGNASSSNHAYGWSAKMAVDKARKQVADIIKANPEEIIWTSGATESNNMALLGVIRRFKGGHIITSAVEHKAVIEVAECARNFGAELTVLPVNKYGQVEVNQVKQALRPNTKLMSFIMGNNEIGSINPIAELCALAKDNNILFHTDCAQTIGKVEIDVTKTPIDMLSISGHKIYGPKGIGALYLRTGSVKLDRLMHGGSQEGGLRPGTLNVPGIVGLGKACELTSEHECKKITGWRDKIINTILNQGEGIVLNGHPTERLCNNVSFSFKNLSADVFTLGLSGLAISSGSACTSGSAAPSHVLKALGHSDNLAQATVRIGLGRFTTEEHVNLVIDKILSLTSRSPVDL